MGKRGRKPGFKMSDEQKRAISEARKEGERRRREQQGLALIAQGSRILEEVGYVDGKS